MRLSHHSYLTEMVKALRELYAKNPNFASHLLEYQEAVLSLSMLDLEPARPLLLACYASKHSGSQKPRDPVAMFRSFLLMALLGFTSINKWVAELRGHPDLLILSGFELERPPAIGTYYNFIHRLLDGPYRKQCEHTKRPSLRYQGVRNRFSRHLGDEKALRAEEFENADEGKVRQSVTRALSTFEQHLPEDFTKRLNELLMVCAVVPSAKRGVLGVLDELAVAGDGSAAPSQADGNGHALCQCRKEGIRKCDCSRAYADPEATWGWDSYRDTFYFGYRIHAMSVTHQGRDLPLHLMLDGAHRHDSLMGVEATMRLFKQLRKYLPEARMKYGIFDAGYDANDFYRMWRKLGGIALIVLNPSHAPGADAQGLERSKDGIPLCKAGIEFKRHGVNRKLNKVVYHCPAKYLGRTKGKQHYKVDLSRCPLGVLCEPDSVMGPLVNLHLDGNPRFEVEIPRDSKRWKELFKQRTCTERFFSKIEAKGLKSGCYRRKHVQQFSVLCQGIAAHAKAWVKAEFGGTKASDIWELLDRIETLAG